MLWDGLGFFGFDETKLARLNGSKTSYLDKFRSKHWLMHHVVIASICFYVIFNTVTKLGTVKLQKIELTERSHFYHHAKDVLTLHGVNHFEINDTLKYVQNV